MASDLGVRRATGEPLTPVRKRFFGPSVGQYTFDGSTYEFSRRDQGTVLISFEVGLCCIVDRQAKLQKTWLHNRNVFHWMRLVKATEIGAIGPSA
jgi:hypothetical protein